MHIFILANLFILYLYKVPSGIFHINNAPDDIDLGLYGLHSNGQMNRSFGVKNST